jgi:hypothetical protein
MMLMMIMLLTMMRLVMTMSLPMFCVADGVDDEYTIDDYNDDDGNNDGDEYFHR